MFGFGKKKKIILKAALTGNSLPLEQVPDPTFAEKVIGDGIAIAPTEGLLVAPCNATIDVLFPTGHALALKTKEGLELLLHIGIDTVELKGSGFEKLVKEGDQVKAGQPLVRFDLERIRAESKSIATPILITNPDQVKSFTVHSGAHVAGKSDLMEIELV